MGSILNRKNITGEHQKITVNWLVKTKHFYKDGWGSPSFRKTHNTIMYYKVFEPHIEDNWTLFQAMYFPEEFEGQFFHNGRILDVKGKLIISKEQSYNIYIFDNPSRFLFKQAVDAYKCNELDKLVELCQN